MPRYRWPVLAPVFFLLAVLIVPAEAIAPIGAMQFNVKARVNLATLTRENFAAALGPVGKTQTGLVFYDFADTLCELLAKEAAAFTQQTGIGVRHVCVDGNAATQQLIAEVQAGKLASADLFFGPNGRMRVLTQANVIANIPLVDLLPNASDVEQTAARASRGFEHGGTVVPFHRNQTVLGYNSALVARPPETFEDLLGFAKEHSGKIAVTDPTQGGSGGGFLESALLKFSPDCKNDYYNFALTSAQADAAAVRCMAPVLSYWRTLKPHVRFTNSNENSAKALANNVALIATVWEDDLYTLASKGLIPNTVSPIIMRSGQVGDGDGLFVVSTTDKLEAALLFADFLMSEKVQIDKLEQTGSRTARTTLLTKGKIPTKLAKYLVPDTIYRVRTRPRINGQISNTAADLFVKEIIAK